MKTHWRSILSDWKEDCRRRGRNYPTLPKGEFPGLLKKLMDVDYGDAIRNGFATTGLYPCSLEKALEKLPKEPEQVQGAMQRQLAGMLHDLRFVQPQTTTAQRPKKKDRLPAGASYTCRGDGDQPLITPAVDIQSEMRRNTTRTAGTSKI